jgi:hypothetical protein
MCGNAWALPFGTFDARSAGMGGVGVVTGSRYAAFYNPALLTTADEIHEWFLLAPTVGRGIGDPDELEDGLEALQQAADALDASPSAANRDLVQSRLNAIDGDLYRSSSNGAVMLAIPSRILSGAAFFNTYEWHNARTEVGGDDLSDPANPQYSSTVAHRGVRLAENGISAAKIWDSNKKWLQDVAIGFSAKFLLIEGYGYAEPVRSAEVDIDRAGRRNDSQFALDVGMLKEFGVWKLGLVAKNLIPGRSKYGNTGEDFRIEPQVRMGLAYQSRRAILELDIDLTENQKVGFDSPTQIAALGWEYRPWRWIALRAGYRQNLTGTEAAYSSGGLGLLIGGVYLDVAAYSGDEGEGVAAQLGVQF